MLFPQELNQLVFIVWTKRDLSKNEMDFPKQIPFKQCESYESLSDYDIWMSFIGYFMPMFQKRITKEISLFQSDNFGCKLLMQRCHWLDIALFFFFISWTILSPDMNCSIEPEMNFHLVIIPHIRFLCFTLFLFCFSKISTDFLVFKTFLVCLFLLALCILEIPRIHI